MTLLVMKLVTKNKLIIMEENEKYIIDISMEEIVKHYKPVEYKILLFCEPDIQEVDDYLKFMEVEFVHNELYEFAAVIRDEIIRRKRKFKNGIKSKI